MNTEDTGKISSMPSRTSKFSYKSITWWALLCSVVLAVPSLAIIFTSVVHASGSSNIVIFIAVCWLCVYLGMRLMKTSRIAPIMFEHVNLSEQAKQHCINMVSIIESETDKWKKRYEKCEAVFMSLSRQPAWDYLDEVTQILSRIKQTVEHDASVAFTDIVALNSWVESAKPIVLNGYLSTLEATYGYAKAEFMHQGKNIDELFPELGKGHIATFVKAPSYANAYAHELIATLKQEHPMLAQTNLMAKQLKVA